MSYKNIVWGILIFSIAVISASFLPIWTADCPPPDSLISDPECGRLLTLIVEPIFWGFVPLFIVSVVLLFVRQEVFTAWRKFALPGFIVMLVILLYTYNNTPRYGGFMDWGTDDQFATVLLPSLFFLISLTIITVSSYKHRSSLQDITR